MEQYPHIEKLINLYRDSGMAAVYRWLGRFCNGDNLIEEVAEMVSDAKFRTPLTEREFHIVEEWLCRQRRDNPEMKHFYPMNDRELIDEARRISVLTDVPLPSLDDNEDDD